MPDGFSSKDRGRQRRQGLSREMGKERPARGWRQIFSSFVISFIFSGNMGVSDAF
jgi:hypothetical protein